MGNIPSKWAARGSALGAAAVLATLAFFGATWVGERLAYGFTFDWYVHETHAAYERAEVLTAAGLTASAAAFLTLTFLVPAVAWITRWRMRALRFTPPRYARPNSVDVHSVRLGLIVPLAASLLVMLLGYVTLSSPLLEEREPIASLTPEAYVLLVALGGAFGAMAGALVGTLTTFQGLVSGRLVPHSPRNIIARISLFGMRNAKTTVALVLALTLVAGAYATKVNTNVDVADVLPRGDPNTAAADNLTDTFKSSFTQQLTFQFRVLDTQEDPAHRALYESENRDKLPFRVTEQRPENITDELYVRAIAEVIEFVVAHETFAGSSGGMDIFKLTNWTLAGGETEQNTAGDAAFSLPPTDRAGELRYEAVERGVVGVGALYVAVDALTSPSWQQTAVLVTADPFTERTAKEIGEEGLHVRDAWLEHVRQGKSQYEVFGDENPPQFTVDLPIANAHASELTKHDFQILLPIIAAFIAMTLFVAFRNLTSVVSTFSMLGVAVVWTFGVMGAMEIPLNTLNLAVVPLIMGIGIDYGIHMMNEYMEQRHEGKTPEEAWTFAGGGSALALFLGMLTTVSGLMVMVVSPSLLVAQLGLLAAVAIVSCFVLAVLFVPAVVTLMGGGKVDKRVEFAPSRVMPALATGVSRARWFVLFVLVLMAGAALASASTIHREAFGDPPRNWLEDDPLRQEHEKALAGFYDTTEDNVKANVLVFEGDMTDPAAHRYIGAITNTLRENDRVGRYTVGNASYPSRIIGDTLKDLPFIMNTYLTVRGGAPGAAQFIGGGALAPYFEQMNVTDPVGTTETYPQTQAEIKQILDDVFQSPLKQFGNIFIDPPNYQMAVTIFSVEAANYEEAVAVWDEIQAAIAANEAMRPEGMQVHFFGNTAINYLFVAKQVPWLGYMSIATNILVAVIVFAFTRDVRATALVASVNFLTSTFWIGVLPAFGIGLAINLTLPLVFIFCMGSDYALHLGLRCKKVGDTRAAMEGVGKGVLYSFVTTFGAFLVFTQISDLAGRRGMVATAIAIAVVFAATVLIVPIFYPVKGRLRGKGGAGERNVPLVEQRAVAAKPAASVPVRADRPPTDA